MVSFSLESKFSVQMVDASSPTSAIQKLKEHSDIELVIFSEEDKASVKYDDFLRFCALIPQVFITTGMPAPKNRKIIATIPAKNVLENLYFAIQEFMGKSGKAEKLESGNDKDFCRIRTGLLIRVSPLKGDVFIRLSKDHYVKMFREGDHFDGDDLEKYLTQKKVEYFYLSINNVAEFIQKYKRILDEYLTLPKMNPAAAEDVVLTVHETVHELSQKIGFTAEVREMTKQNVKLAIKSMSQNPKLKDILKRLQHDNERYISAHSLMLSSIACALAKGMSWSSEGTFYKLSMAGFLHDVTLHNQQLGTVRGLVELHRKRDLFTEEEMEAYKGHPYDAAEIARNFNEIPPDVDTIIVQHHERPNGAGFPRGLSTSRISPLACVFIIAHELVQYTIEGEMTFEEIANRLHEDYSAGNFKKVLKVLAGMEGLKIELSEKTG